MEIPVIHRFARRHLEEANAMKQSMLNLHDELAVIKAEQRMRRAQSMRTLVEATFDRSLRRGYEARQKLQEARQATQMLQEREQRLASLEHRMRSAVDKAHVFIHLARRASGGHIYAKHQADIMWEKQI